MTPTAAYNYIKIFISCEASTAAYQYIKILISLEAS